MYLLWRIGWLLLCLAAATGYVECHQQKPLGDQKPLSYPTFTIREQTDELCDAGSRFWTGTVNITADKSMFFWFFESRRDPETDPLVLWMSGGPGATGELGLTMGSGPCVVNADGNSTSRRKFSFTDRANVVYIDQPIGVGFSHITNRDDIAVTLQQGARDVYSFLSHLSTNVFPNLSGRSWNLAGESMGGHYVLGYAHYMASLEGQTSLINISSIVIIDGYVDASRQSVGYYDFFCTDWALDGRKAPLMNESACADMAAAVPSCELLGSYCRESYDLLVCGQAFSACEETVGEHFLSGVVPGGWDPYDGRHTCESPPLCSNFAHGRSWKFFNQPWVQEQLGQPYSPFELIDFDTGMRWHRAKSLFLPVTREMTWLLDNTCIRILVINGNDDIIINTPGQMRMLDEQPWHGQARYRSQGYQDWYFGKGDITSDVQGWDVKRGGFWKGTDRLAMYAIDEAGHFAPYHQPEAVGAVLRTWLGTSDNADQRASG
ncbi:hypothetical protein BFJ69_g7643 [Fusarium oxysporum]|uniref:carboxypeptidase C n=1 Tax=Fusarium oxysporum TaxID=5507 RepID=A0A420N5Q3_FUSOX|nr:hypothetical protein BFJ69_g7643 [Fusarium oxysporum]